MDSNQLLYRIGSSCCSSIAQHKTPNWNLVMHASMLLLLLLPRASHVSYTCFHLYIYIYITKLFSHLASQIHCNYLHQSIKQKYDSDKPQMIKNLEIISSCVHECLDLYLLGGGLYHCRSCWTLRALQLASCIFWLRMTTTTTTTTTSKLSNPHKLLLIITIISIKLIAGLQHMMI